MPRYTRLAGEADFTKDSYSTMVEQNLVEFFRYAFLEAGAFASVGVLTPGTTSAFDPSRLYPVQADGYADGTLWQAQKTDWCYEGGLESGYQPEFAGGVYVNGIFYPTAISSFGGVEMGVSSFGDSGVTAYPHYIDFPHGRVVFTNPLPLNSVVQAAFSYRIASFFTQGVPWFREVVLDGFYTEQANAAGGVLAVLNNYRVQTPLVVVEASMNRNYTPYQLGSLAHWAKQKVLFHVLSESKEERDRVVDAIVQQEDATIYLFDTNARRVAGDAALDWRGSPISGGKTYADLVQPPPDGYRLKSAYFKNMQGQEVSQTMPMFRGVVSGTLTTVL